MRRPQSERGMDAVRTTALAPLWEQLVRQRRVPPGVDVAAVLREVRARLRAPEWPVTQHALRLLADLLPLVHAHAALEDLLPDLVACLGHSAPAVRRAAADAMRAMADGDACLRALAAHGLGMAADASVAAGVMLALPGLLGCATAGGGGISAVINALAKRLVTPPHQNLALETLLRLQEVMGAPRFARALDSVHPQVRRDLRILTQAASAEATTPQGFLPASTDDQGSGSGYWSDESPRLEDVDENDAGYDVDNESSSDEGDKDDTASLPEGRVILETEIKFSEETAITMTVLEADEVPSPPRRTGRRVTFGGESVKTRSPDPDDESQEGPEEEVTVHVKLVTSQATEEQQQDSSAEQPENELTDEKQETDDCKDQSLEEQIPDQSDIDYVSDPVDAVESQFGGVDNHASPQDGTVDILEIKENKGIVISVEHRSRSVDDDDRRRSRIPVPVAPSLSWSQHSKVPKPSHQEDDWQDSGAVGSGILHDIYNTDDWRARLRAVRELSSQSVLSRFEPRHLASLSRFFLERMTHDRNGRVVAAALDAVANLLYVQPPSVVRSQLPRLVAGLARRAGAGNQLAVRVAAAGAVRRLLLLPGAAALVVSLAVAHANAAPTSKLREAALLVALYAATTHPMPPLDAELAAAGALQLLLDPRRRVRQASLELLAAVALRLPQGWLEKHLSTAPTGAAAAVWARLSRSQLPVCTADGLLAYGLAVPRSSNQASAVPGDDVSWILAGSGAVSAGSGKAATTATSSSGSSDCAVNPWTERSIRSSHATQARAQVAGGACAIASTIDCTTWRRRRRRIRSAEDMLLCRIVGYRPFVLTTTKDDQRGRGPSPWSGETIALQQGSLRPLYLRFSNSPPEESKAAAASWPLLHHTWPPAPAPPPPRMLTPSQLRGRRVLEPLAMTSPPDTNKSPIKIPPLTSRRGEQEPEERPRRRQRTPPKISTVKNSPEIADDFSIPQKPLLARAPIRQDTGPIPVPTPPSIGNGSLLVLTPPAEPFLPPVDTSSESPPPPPPPAQSTPPTPADVDFRSLDETDAAETEILETSQERLTKSSHSKDSLTEEHPSSPDLKAVEGEEIVADEESDILVVEQKEDETSKKSTPEKTTAAIIDLRLDVDSPKKTSPQKRQTVVVRPAPRSSHVSRNNSQQQLFPVSSKPVERPRESLATCLQQMDSPEWEVTLAALHTLVRLLRHHPDTAATQVHGLSSALAKQVRNLRSQVARAACQAAAEMFVVLRRAAETDVEELVGSLFHRAADTNRFLRADCNSALDKMVDTLSPGRAVHLIVTKGASHQNAVVRTAAARLLSSITSKLGAERIMTSPREMRDKMFITGATMLMEGSLDTRCHAKQLFHTLSSHPSFNTVITEVVPLHILRNISKTLKNLK